MNFKKSLIKRCWAVLLSLMCLSLTACQPTPDDESIVGKDDLSEEILKESAAAPAPSSHDSGTDEYLGELWKEVIEYDSRNKLTINARISKATSASVISVSNDPFSGS